MRCQGIGAGVSVESLHAPSQRRLRGRGPATSAAKPSGRSAHGGHERGAPFVCAKRAGQVRRRWVGCAAAAAQAAPRAEAAPQAAHGAAAATAFLLFLFCLLFLFFFFFFFCVAVAGPAADAAAQAPRNKRRRLK